jgi:hypothetical protein
MQEHDKEKRQLDSTIIPPVFEFCSMRGIKNIPKVHARVKQLSRTRYTTVCNMLKHLHAVSPPPPPLFHSYNSDLPIRLVLIRGKNNSIPKAQTHLALLHSTNISGTVVSWNGLGGRSVQQRFTFVAPPRPPLISA